MTAISPCIEGVEMAQCFHRKRAWLTPGNALSFKPVEGARLITIPCGKCLPCRVNNASMWATRAMHESQYVKESCFVTLTYDPEHCPADYSLNKHDVQCFIKRVRKHLGNGRLRAYFGCGEYGTLRGRPHYHFLLLGWCPKDLVFHHKSYSGLPVYTSEIMQRLWGKGFCPVGTCSHESAGYVARYQKKATADNSGNRPHPFFVASRNIQLASPVFPRGNTECGGLGAQWLLDHYQELRHGFLRHPTKHDVKLRIPEYYFDLLQRWFPKEYEELKEFRLDFAQSDHYGVWLCDDFGTASVFVPDASKVDWSAIAQELSVPEESDHEQLLHDYKWAIQYEERKQEAKLTGLTRNLEDDTIPGFPKLPQEYPK